MYQQIVRIGISLTSVMFAVAALAEKPIDFNRDIRPILSDKCFFCHGPDKHERKAGLRLDLREGATKKLKSDMTAIVPGKPEESELVYRLSPDFEDELMPPEESHKKLSKKEKDLLIRWVKEGAPYAEHWAYVPPKKHRIPEVKNKQQVYNWVDNFIVSRLEAEGLQPSKLADKTTLVRRLYFDLTGLPPTHEEVQTFINDKRDDAYERLVDRLLSSPRYGERMAMYWLDLVRFADTVGYHGDQDHNASPYRDWVIRAFNENMPFDKFTIWQLAGDLLPNPTDEMLIATCYNRLLQTSHEGGVQPKEYTAIYAADRVRNVSGVWFGATIGCAQCHDHKYDPYTAEDFYSLSAFFADVDEAAHFKNGTNSLPTRREPEKPVLTHYDKMKIDAFNKRIQPLKDELAKIEDEKSKQAVELQQQITALRKERDEIAKNPRKVMYTKAVKPRVVRVLPRGDWLDDSGDIVQPAVPAFMGKVKTDGERATRLDLARWLTTPRDKGGVGGLTSRVFMNRLWYLYFGVGLSKNLDDLGAQGDPVVHGELLDQLSVSFIENGWDIKKMVKLLVMSRTYRQTSAVSSHLFEVDPYNQLYARQSRYRLQAEMVRDNALAVSGLLVNELGGASVKPYQPAGYYQHMNFPQRKYKEDRDKDQWRRGVYMHWQRMFLHPQLLAFDAPTREECAAERAKSNTPLASLTLLNDPTFVEAARKLAERVMQQVEGDDAKRLVRIYELVLQRKPSEEELKLLRGLLKKHREQFAKDPKGAEKLVSVGIAPRVQALDVIELAGWTSVARVLLNLNETITRN